MCAAEELTGHLDSRRELHELLLRVEEAHRADILTYSSGHLNPYSLSQKVLGGTTTVKGCRWICPFAPEKGTALQQHAPVQPQVERIKIGLANATVTLAAAPVSASSPLPEKVLKHPSCLQNPTRIIFLKTSTCRSTETGLAPEWPEDRYCLSESLITGKLCKDSLKKRRESECSVGQMEDLRELKGLGHSKAAKKQEKQVEQVLKRLCAEPQLGRERLHVFSKIFGDVCDGSQVFGQILREIKREYDLYLNMVISSQPNPQIKAHMPGAAPAGELKEARDAVLRLENNARTALLENDQARMELQRERDQVQQINEEQMQVDQQDLKQGEIPVSPSDQVLHKRLQVWTGLEDVQILENEIIKQMVPKDTTRATERCIRDLEAEIMALSTSNKYLCETNEDLRRSISSLLDKANVTNEIQKEFWGRFGHPET